MFDRRQFLGLGAATCATLSEPFRGALDPTSLGARLEAAEPTGPPRFNGRNLDNWRVVDTDVFKRHGAVVAKEGAVELAQGDPGTAIVWTGDAPPKINYEVRLEGQRTAGDDFFCGLTFPIHDSHCTLILGGWGGSVTGLSNIDDFPAVENETTNAIEVRPGKWHRIRLRVTPREIQAWFDDSKIVDLDPRGKRFSIWWEQEPVRPFGIATWNTAALLKNLRVEKLA